jgi:Ca-activated chloride channel family protein
VVSSGRHRQPLHRRAVTAAAAALAVVVVAAGLRFGLPSLVGSACAPVKVTVAVAKDIAPVVQQVAASAEAGCVKIDVQPAESSDVAAAISREQRASLSGLDATSGTTAVPDVWIADSSSWLTRLRGAVPGFTVADEGSVAVSPVVLGMPEPDAKQLGWPAKKLGYGDVVHALTTSTTLRAGIAEPARDAVGLSGLLALDTAAGGDLPGVLHSLAAGRSALRDNLLQQFPQTGDAGTVAADLGVAPLSEHDVVEYNAGAPDVHLAAVYPTPAPAAMDYPFIIMPGAGPAQESAAHTLFQALRSTTALERLGRDGFRGPDGRSPVTFTAPDGAPATVTAPAPGKQDTDDAAINRALAGWSGVVAPARLLAVMDASKSMGTAGRMTATLQAARDGLSLFSDDWQVGLWEFDGDSHRELVPIGPLIDNRAALNQALPGITPHGADSGLYGTILDAYQTVQNGWQAGRVNSVLVMTDGVTGPAQGDLSLATLLAKLKAAKDPGRPVQVVIVGVGGAVSRAPLDQITSVVGGGVFVAATPAAVADVFSQAIALRVAVSR